MKNHKNVLVLPSFLTLKNDVIPTGSFFSEQAKLLIKEGFNIKFLYNENRKFKFIDILKLGKLLNLYHFQFNIENDANLEIYKCYSWKILPISWRIGEKIWIYTSFLLFKYYYLKKNKVPNLIHAQNCLTAGGLALLLFKKYKIPYVILEHSSHYSRNLYNSKQLNRVKIILENAVSIASVSHFLASQINSRLNSNYNFKIIPNFIDTEFFKPEEKTFKKDFLFISICNLNRNKRIDRIIIAFSNLSKLYFNVRLEIYGDGDEYENLQNLILENKMEGKITLKGGVNKIGVKKALENANCLISSSEFETFGVVLIEALSMGVPVIATNSGGPSEIIKNEFLGLLIDNNQEDLNEALRLMIDRRDLFDSNYLRNYAIEHYSIMAVLNLYKKFYLLN
jgi:L-malate glycosyltransferase